MRLSKPRIAPLQDTEFTPEQVERLAKSRQKDGSVLNIFRTLVRSPDAFRAFSWWGGYVMARNSLTPARPGDRDPARRLAVQVRL